MRERRRCGFHRLTCAWRMAMGALAVCSGYDASVGTAALAQAPSNDQEVGMAHWGPTYVWFRVTDVGLVQVYASTGYRSAFVQPVTVTASDLDRWASLLDQLTAPTDARPASMTGDATPRGTDEENPHVVLGGGDLVLEMEAAAASESKVRVWVGATRSDAVVALVVPEAAAEAAGMLREAAQRARVTANAAAARAAVVASAPAAAPPPTRGADPVAAPVVPVMVAATTPAAPSAPLVESNDAPVSVVNSAPTAAPVSPAAAAPDAGSPLTTASISSPLVAERTTTTVAGLDRPSAHMSPVHGSHDSALPVLRTTTTTKPMHVAASALATVTTVNTARQRETVHQPTSAIPAVAHRPRSTAIPTAADAAHGVDDVTVQNLVGQWRPDLMYCYTQYGLREHAALAGALVVRLALSPNGSVGHSVIGVRKWSGDGGPAVESCIRSRIAGWHFPPASAGSIHSFSLEFAPGRG